MLKLQKQMSGFAFPANDVGNLISIVMQRKIGLMGYLAAFHQGNVPM